MARTRQIDPCYPFEKEIRALSITARYFYILSWCHMSDPNKETKKVGGVMPYDLFFLKNNIFPEENINIAPIVEEIIVQRRYFSFETEGKQWLWCPTMPKHQTVNHPSKGKYPDPPITLQEDYRSGKLALTLSRVEMSRVELKNQPYWAAFKNTTQEYLKAVSKAFNIYQFLTKLKKDKKIEIPEEVIIRICASYQRNKTKIKSYWPWFIVTTKAEWEFWNAEKSMREGLGWKDTPVAPAIKELLVGILKSKDVNKDDI